MAAMFYLLIIRHSFTDLFQSLYFNCGRNFLLCILRLFWFLWLGTFPSICDVRCLVFVWLAKTLRILILIKARPKCLIRFRIKHWLNVYDILDARSEALDSTKWKLIDDVLGLSKNFHFLILIDDFLGVDSNFHNFFSDFDLLAAQLNLLN